MENNKSTKKIAIATMYFNNINYGANLQAYALSELCKKNGYNVEFIRFYDGSKFKYILSKIKNSFLFFKSSKDILKRKRSIRKFRDKLSHTKVYFKNNLYKVNNLYDIFIVGSDQVWNPAWINDLYKLNFVNNSKYKFSYAASLGRNYLTEQEKNDFKQMLENYNAISVREYSSVDLLSGLTEKSVNWVLDPTLILDIETWDKFCEKSIFNYDNYMFCYFLGSTKEDRILATNYAQKYNLKIITLPYLNGVKRECDKNFGDVKLYNVSPNLFLSLIKKSAIVFTDSFHATVFSHIFKRDFFVFNHNNSEMIERMISLCKLFRTENRIISEDICNMEYIENIEHIDYNQEFVEFEEMKEKSLNFLIENLTRAEEYVGNNK